jgi:vanillate O-demethylase monooxygenase subunit
VAPQGVYPPDHGPDDRAAHAKIVYAMTPSTENITFDFWAVARDFAIDDETVTEYLYESNRTVVQQDVDALNLLETIVAGEADGFQELSINIDTGALAARRLLRKQIERSSSPVTAAVPVP